MKFKYEERDPRSREEQFEAYIAGLPNKHPERLKFEAEGMPWKDTAKFDLTEYGETIAALRKRGYSYAEIAAWLGEKIGSASLNRGHVYRAYQIVQERWEQDYEEAVARGEAQEYRSISAISAERAEEEAAKADERKES